MEEEEKANGTRTGTNKHHRLTTGKDAKEVRRDARERAREVANILMITKEDTCRKDSKEVTTKLRQASPFVLHTTYPVARMQHQEQSAPRECMFAQNASQPSTPSGLAPPKGDVLR